MTAAEEAPPHALHQGDTMTDTTTRDPSTLLAALREVRRKGERARAELEHGLRESAAAGIPERKLAEASGISRMTVRRIIGRG